MTVEDKDADPDHENKIRSTGPVPQCVSCRICDWQELWDPWYISRTVGHMAAKHTIILIVLW